MRFWQASPFIPFTFLSMLVLWTSWKEDIPKWSNRSRRLEYATIDSRITDGFPIHSSVGDRGNNERDCGQPVYLRPQSTVDHLIKQRTHHRQQLRQRPNHKAFPRIVANPTTVHCISNDTERHSYKTLLPFLGLGWGARYKCKLGSDSISVSSRGTT